VLAPDFPQHLEDLGGQLAGRADDEGAEAIVLGPLSAVESFDYWNEESEGFTATRFGGAEDVSSLESEGNGRSLDVGENLEVGRAEAGSGRLAEWKICKVLYARRFGVLLQS